MKKIKISDFRIPIALLSILIFCVLSAIFLDRIIESEILGWVIGITSALTAILLLFVYYPIAIIKLFKDKLENPESFVNKTGILSTSFIFLGIIFKLMHWPGAGVLIILGCTLFVLSFIPSWYAAQFKKSNWFQRILYFTFSNSLGFLILGYQFKSMHWPGADILWDICSYSFYLGFLPLAIFTVLFRIKRDYFKIEHRFLFGFMIAFVISGIISFRFAFNNAAGDSNNYKTINKNLMIYEKRANFLHEGFEKKNIEDSLFQKNKELAKKLKEAADSCVNYLEDLKIHLVLETDNLPESKKDSISFENIEGKANYDIPTSVLIGNDEMNPKSGKYSALEMKQNLIDFITQVDKISPEDYRLQIKQANPFDFSDIVVDSVNKVVDSWEIANFYHEVLSKDYTIITGFQANVRFLEMTLMNELFNRANSGSKDNMAAQLAELAVKYESEKQEKKIAMLQKDQELNDVKIAAKDKELEDTKNTITLFIFGAILVAVLLAFVIRSNILRKQANKELADQKETILNQKTEVENQKHLVEEKQKEILDSINYAKRLQDAILARPEEIDRHFPNNFLWFNPKDIVAGDFYFFEATDTHIFYAAADCTGHGVPGAMVSIVCSNALSRCVKEFKLTDPGQILDKARELVLDTFSKSSADVKDGMDISFLVYDKKSSVVKWSGANNPLWYVQNGEFFEIKPNKQPIGKSDNPLPFISHEIKLSTETMFYLFTDGYADQFGGPKGKKFKYKQLEEAALSVINQPMKAQKELLQEKFMNWKGNLEQIDDVCIIGVKIS
ncbi:MAG: SpoIIE family protein phosphatase [Bacteroidota bacterium]